MTVIEETTSRQIAAVLAREKTSFEFRQRKRSAMKSVNLGTSVFGHIWISTALTLSIQQQVFDYGFRRRQEQTSTSSFLFKILNQKIEKQNRNFAKKSGRVQNLMKF